MSAKKPIVIGPGGLYEQLQAGDSVAAADVSGLAAVATSGSASDLGAGTLPGGRLPAFTGGDVTSPAGSLVLTLAASGATAGTYTSVTVDAKGRVTGGTNPTTLAGYGITDAQPLDAELTALAAVTSAANKVPYFTGSGAAAVADFTAAGRALVDDADAAAQRTTLGLGTVATLASDTDGTLAANSDTRVATQKAVKTYVDNAVTGLLEYKGATDCSASPNYPAASKGDAYVVSVAGKVGGASGKSVDAGDVYFATADNAGGTEAAVGTSWVVLEHNLQGALLGANNLSDVADATTARGNLSAAKSGANTDITSVYLSNTGLKIKDTDATHGLSVVPGSNLTADRTLTVTTGDADRTLTLSGNATVSGTNTGDQTITLTGNVTGSGTGSFATTIAAGVVTNAMLAGSIDLTAKVTGILPAANGGLGVDASTGGTANTFFARPNGSTGAASFRAIVAADVPTLNQNTTGSAAKLTTARSVYGNSFDGSADVTAQVGTAYGGVPTGTVLDFAGFTVPTGYLACDGTAVSRATYSALQSALTTAQSATRTSGSPTVTGLSDTSLIRVGAAVEGTGFAAGTTVTAVVSGTSVTLSNNAGSSGTSTLTFFAHGNGDGSTTFNTPDLRRRAVVGSGGTGSTTLASRLGATGGAETHTLALGEMASHNHVSAGLFIPTTGAGTAMNLTLGGGAYNYLNNVAPQGGGGAHNNMQPSLVMQKIIKT